MSGVKHDKEKLDMGLLFREIPNALEGVAAALQMGGEKYGVGNWLKVEDGCNRYLSAMVRHLTAYHKGEKLDPESGLSHLSHLAVNALFLLDLEKRNEANSGGGNGGVFGIPGRTLVLEEEALCEGLRGGCGGEKGQARIPRHLVQESEVPSAPSGVCLSFRGYGPTN